jgi:hypothetical protein
MTDHRHRSHPAAPALLAVLVAASSASSTASADDTNPFSVIVERNPFALRPPPEPPPAEPPKAPEPPANIELTGISIFEGVKKVYLNVKSKDGKTTEGKTFKEGEKQDQIEVLSIDPVAGAVRLRNAGKDGLLTFKDNGAQVPVGAAPKPTLPVPVPGIRPGLPTPAGLGSPEGTQQIPSRSLRVPPIPAQPQGGGASYGVPVQGVRQTAALDSAQPAPTDAAPAAQPAERPLTLDEQVLIMQANAVFDEQERQKGRPVPPMPPLPYAQ